MKLTSFIIILTFSLQKFLIKGIEVVDRPDIIGYNNKNNEFFFETSHGNNSNGAQNFSIKCEGSDRIHWQIPKVPFPYEKWTKVETRETTFKDIYNRTIFTNTLSIINATYPFTGKYICLYYKPVTYYGIGRIVKRSSSAVYVFIFDGLHLFTNPRKFIMAESMPPKPDVILPCIPTHPNISTTYEILSKSKSILVENAVNNVSLKPISHLISNKGIQLNFYEGNCYKCIFRFKNVVEEKIVIISRKDENILRFSNTTLMSSIGSTLDLNTTLTSRKSPNIIYWLMPPYDQIVCIYPKHKCENIFDDLLNYSTNINTESSYNDNHVLFKKYNLTKCDHGIFTCVIDFGTEIIHANIKVTILNVLEKILLLRPVHKTYVVTQEMSKNATKTKLSFDISNQKNYSIVWYNNKHQNILQLNESRYFMETTEAFTSLQILNSTYNDTGYYTVEVINDFNSSISKSSIYLDIGYGPVLSVPIREWVLLNLTNRRYKFRKNVSSIPISFVSCWLCNFSGDFCTVKVKIHTRTINESMLNFYGEFNISDRVWMQCLINNTHGSINYTLSVMKTDENHLKIESSPKTDEANEVYLIEGSMLKLQCIPSQVIQMSTLKWTLNNVSISNSKNVLNTISRINTANPRTLYNELNISRINLTYSGVYTCEAIEQDFVIFSKSIQVVVQKRTKPKFTGPMLNGTILEANSTELIELECQVNGIPKPTIEWFKNGIELNLTDRYENNSNGQVIRIITGLEEDSGIYSCKITNELGSIIKYMKLLIKNRDSINNGLPYMWIGIVAFIIILLIIVTLGFFWVKIRNKKRLDQEINTLNLTIFEEGAPEFFNSKLELNMQAEFLPYNRKWDFPKDRLKLGRKLGCGAFGVVFQAEADNILHNEKRTIVAVKMAKSNMDIDCIRSLIGELKILVHLEPHVNIVNLLGACIDGISRKELLIIYEYCQYGNMQKYLRMNRDKYIDLIDHSTGTIDHQLDFINKCQNFLRNCNCSDQTHYNSFEVNITTRDLIDWSFQVARGMRYITSQNVLHGDLAARNILLSDGGNVKISDFGLSRNLYQCSKYKKKSKEPLPYKWLAIESIADQVFSMQSDVWSFGVVLWEFFSLGKAPYPGEQVNQSFIDKLFSGYRMECPLYAPDFIYKTMLKCWHRLPHKRPTFEVLCNYLYEASANFGHNENSQIESNRK